MNKSLLVAVVSGALALPMAAQVQADEPATVYGSLRYGVAASGSDAPNTDTEWDIGSNRSSRFGVRGSVDAGPGLTAGFHLERNLNSSLSARHHNVSLTGAFGTVKFGRQSSPYYGASTWDGSQTLGGLTDFRFRTTGVGYQSDLGGPFNFAVLAGDGADGAPIGHKLAPADQTGATVTVDHTAAKSEAGGGVDHIEVTGSLAAGPISFNVGFMQQVDDAERIGGTVAGGMAGFNWTLGYETATDAATCGTAPATMSCDEDRYGFHLGYTIGSGNAYVQFSERDSDNNARDTSGFVFGYWHALSDNVVVYAEHGTTDTESAAGAETTTTTTVFAVKVGF